jgi:hypothetical protein
VVGENKILLEEGDSRLFVLGHEHPHICHRRD